jgi:hypothetical protein
MDEAQEAKHYSSLFKVSDSKLFFFFCQMGRNYLVINPARMVSDPLRKFVPSCILLVSALSISNLWLVANNLLQTQSILEH